MSELILGQMRDVQLADLLDIALVTTLFYSLIVLVRRTQARLVARGILLLITLFIVARALDLRLTTWLLQGFFAVFVVMLVVIFQEELRQMFERLALWGLRRNAHLPSYGTAEIVVSSAVDLARSRVGALIVLAGRQPLERHLHGGLELGGRMSEPLLRSIFDPHSPGHDGAVIVRGDLVERFATQLPLSTDIRQLAGVGTRHSAALGLSERTDALCIVVSEERGALAVAQGGQLHHLRGAPELEAAVRGFLADLAPAGRGGRGVVWSLVRENWAEKIAALLLVVGLWYLYVPGSRPVTQIFPIPVKVVNVPPGYALEGVEPAEVMAIVTGQRRNFYLFDPERIDVTVDATLARYGRRTFAISEQQISHPPELSIEDVEPEQVRIRLREVPETNDVDAAPASATPRPAARATRR